MQKNPNVHKTCLDLVCLENGAVMGSVFGTTHLEQTTRMMALQVCVRFKVVTLLYDCMYCPNPLVLQEAVRVLATYERDACSGTGKG